MSKGIKFKDNIYLDSRGIVHNKQFLSDLLNIPKNVIMVRLSENKTVPVSTAWDTYKIPYDSLVYQRGTGFSFDSSTGLITYNGPKTAVKITNFISRAESTTAGNLYPTSSGSAMYETIAGATNPRAEHKSVRALSNGTVLQGSFRPSGTGNAVLQGTALYTYMIIEEI